MKAISIGLFILFTISSMSGQQIYSTKKRTFDKIFFQPYYGISSYQQNKSDYEYLKYQLSTIAYSLYSLPDSTFYYHSGDESHPPGRCISWGLLFNCRISNKWIIGIDLSGTKLLDDLEVVAKRRDYYSENTITNYDLSTVISYRSKSYNLNLTYDITGNKNYDSFLSKTPLKPYVSMSIGYGKVQVMEESNIRNFLWPNEFESTGSTINIQGIARLLSNITIRNIIVGFSVETGLRFNRYNKLESKSHISNSSYFSYGGFDSAVKTVIDESIVNFSGFVTI